MKWINSLLSFWLVLGLVVSMVPREAAAQFAPSGAHYAGRPSDTGYGGTFVNATGVYAASVSLDLPAERAGLPVPLQIVYGGRGVGAAGLGWDIPLSYIKRDRTLAHRRPAYGQYVLPEARERVYLSLLGQGIELIPNGQTWVARNGTLELTVRKSADTWLVYDGEGRTYTFIQPANIDKSLWLLKSVSVAGGANVQLAYQINTWPIDGGSGIEINLIRIGYNTTPAPAQPPFAGCAKHEVALTYGNGSTKPLSVSMNTGSVHVRFRTLTLVDVKSRATCGAAFQSLRRYEFQYLTDVDTKLPRLRTVRMFGRQGTPEANTVLPIASYEYGAATRDGTLRYEVSQTVVLPPDDDGTNISNTAIDPTVNAPVSGTGYAMWQSLTDVTGDGRPDFVFKRNDKLWVAFNQPAPAGKTDLRVPVPLSDATFANGAFSTHTTTERRFLFGTANRNTMNIWRQAIDVNGDGRIDIIDAAEEPKKWVVYLNTPGGPAGLEWQRRSFSVVGLGLALVSSGHVIDGGYVPLSRRTTGVSTPVNVCRKSNGTKWVSHDGTITSEWRVTDPQTLIETVVPVKWECDDDGVLISGPPADMPGCILDLERRPICPPSNVVAPERTFVEWELTDLNGDGYPDFVFNSLPLEFKLVEPDFDPDSDESGEKLIRQIRSQIGLPPGTGLRASFNQVGVRFEIDEKHPFSRSITLNAPSSNLGVGMWESVGNVQQQVAGLADVNGDGLVDRVIPQIQPKQTRAYLGTYLGTARTFSNVYITLPGELARQESDQAAQCKVGPRFTSSLTQGLRDLTGDGIPDYYDKGRVWIGTGSGFAPSSIPVEVAGAHFMFSHQTESCDGNFSNTDGGLFDIDGDGKPEVIGLVPLNGGRAYLVSQLAAGSVPRTLEAGRLTVVDNGYGARTQIAYMSAKEDLFTNHQVPFPEIVVSSVETEGTQHLGGTLFGTRYAYGGAEMIFNWAHDGFIFSGYRRTAELRVYNKEQDKAEGVSTVIDTWPLIPVSPPATKEERWLRTQRVGHVRDIYTLRGMFGTDPWPLLTVDANDEGVIGVSHYEWGAKLFEGPASLNTGRDCVDMLEPLDFEASLSALGAAPLIPCRAHGFVFPLSNESWYGSRPPPMTNNVQTRSRALEVDDFGRVTFAEYEGDLFRSDDNICVESTFATPNAAFPRVLAAPASRRITDCGRRFTYAGESWAYDGLPVGIVSNGRMTSHTVDRRATDNGALLRTVRAFDATYNAAGNLTTLRSQRDGAMRTFTFSYDPFGLVRNKTRVDATGLPSTESLVTYNPVSLEPLSSIDINGTQRGAIFDGFGRLLRSTVTPPGGALGVVSTVNYEGFSGADPNGRRILLKEFSDPMPPADVATATGRTATVFLDELGRERRMELALGSDYANEVLVAGSRIYDGLGRVTFEADPYPMSQNAAHAYGTSYHFKNTGDVDCIIRGRRQQELSEVTDVATERFPTCFDRLFENHVETLEVRDAASLQAGSPQAGVVNRIVSSAIGRLIERSTVRPSPGGSRLDYATFSYDRLGQQTSMTRFLNPAGGTDPVRWAWRLDSTGQTLQLDEPETVTRFYTYSDWGEPVETRWTDGTIDRRLVSRYDAFGRLVATEERNNGVADAKTVNNYAYDIGVNVSPHVTPRFVLGRLARASSPNSQVAFSYDAFGRVNARTFTDNESGLYIEKYEYHADGSPALLEFNLPDQSYSREVVKYAYDSARRLRAMTHDDLTGNRELYRADLIDPFGRVRSATHGGNTTYKADYADEGRRLVKEVRVESSSGSRQVIFLRHDPIGRELSRREIKDGEASGPKTNVSYDALGRLANAVKTTGTTTHFNWSFSYDALGNIVKLQDTLGAAGAALTFGTADRDRMCAISYGGPTPTVGVCNVAHDVLGNVVRQPTRTGTRQLSYFSSGAIRTITEGNTTARFEYDAFGQVQKLDVQSATAQNNRRDRRFGELIERRDAEAGGSTMSFLTRHIPGPGGIASRRGPGNNWVFEFGELRGNRFFTNQDGAFVQNVDYQPFGESTSTGASVGSANYTSYQWNGGDALAAFGLSHLGARVYDPVIGRFLSRDPLMVLRSASNTSPYAFALNDPVNFADPTGLDSVYQADQEDDGVWRDFGYFSILSKTSLFWSADILEAGLARFGTIQPPSGFRVLPSRGAIAVSRVSLTGDLLEVGERLVDLMLDHSGDTGVKKGYLVLAVGNLASSKLGWWALPVKVGVAIGTARWEAQQDEEQRQETKIRDLKYPIRVAAQKWAREELPKLREQERLLGERSTVSEDDEEEIHNFLNPVYGPPPPFIGPPLPPNFKPVKPGTPGSGGAGFNPIIFPPPTPPDERPFP